MSGLALHTMKDNGRAALIVMKHVYFREDGFMGKYRPFFNWLYRHYIVDDVINLDSFKLYNKQGAVAPVMLILIGGRKATPHGVAPLQIEAPHLDDIVDNFMTLWKRVQPHIDKPKITLSTIITQLEIALKTIEK